MAITGMKSNVADVRALPVIDCSTAVFFERHNIKNTLAASRLIVILLMHDAGHFSA
jgi:hypothetical protein